jgi:glycosyltransferase involved in cell wall biosynthesis
MPKRISVVIPTRNRATTLRRTLEGYARQTGDHQLLEVFVVDDGSQDDTEAVVRQFTRESDLPLRYLKQASLGISTARNHAIREAKGELILFGDDDIIPSLGMVAEHVAWHCRHPEPEVGVLGHVAWAQELHPTPFMVWSGLYGPQFKFGYCKPGMEVDVEYAYFCNTSVKSRFLRQNGIFSETFRQYGWEDIELSYRLSRKGYRLLYNPDALGYHYKYEKFDNTVRRIRVLFSSYSAFEKTDAGKFFVERRRKQTPERTPRMKALAKPLLRAFKGLIMSLFRQLVDTHVPLPAWVYERVFNYYAFERGQ